VTSLIVFLRCASSSAWPVPNGDRHALLRATVGGRPRQLDVVGAGDPNLRDVVPNCPAQCARAIEVVRGQRDLLQLLGRDTGACGGLGQRRLDELQADGVLHSRPKPPELRDWCRSGQPSEGADAGIPHAR